MRMSQKRQNQVQVDMMDKNSLGPGGVGGDFKTIKGQWTFGFFENMPLRIPSMVERKALHKGLLFASHPHLTPLEINTNFTDLVDMLTNEYPFNYNIITDCRSLLRELGCPIV
ncbi:hypothetical protein FXO38_29132 [Capsicum annuum]|nr:hypothetical protein FXO37_31570 [Capsicum annuum]KAF3626649.1 hypothetical protein FXO38_29132 [Capsicum annuum]